MVTFISILAIYPVWCSPSVSEEPSVCGTAARWESMKERMLMQDKSVTVVMGFRILQNLLSDCSTTAIPCMKESSKELN